MLKKMIQEKVADLNEVWILPRVGLYGSYSAVFIT